MDKANVQPHGNGTRNDRIGIRLPSEVRGRLELAALLADVHLSEIVRRAIERELERLEADR